MLLLVKPVHYLKSFRFLHLLNLLIGGQWLLKATKTNPFQKQLQMVVAVVKGPHLVLVLVQLVELPVGTT